MNEDIPCTLEQGAICVLNDRCKDDNLLSIGATYFLVINKTNNSDEGEYVETVPVFDKFRNTLMMIRINGNNYWTSTEQFICIPSDLLFEVTTKHLNKIQTTIDTIRREIKENQNIRKWENKHFALSAGIPSQRQIDCNSALQELQAGDICISSSRHRRSNNVLVPYFLVISNYPYPSDQVRVAPIAISIKNKQNGQKIRIQGREFWIYIYVYKEMNRNSLFFVKHTGQWLIDEVIIRRIAFEKGENKKYTTLVNVQEKALGAVVCSCSPDGYPDFFFVFIDKNPTLDSALVVPILFKKDKDRPRKSIKINGATYHVGARFPEIHPLKTLYAVPNLQLDTPEKTLNAILDICKQTKTYSLYQEGIELNNRRRNQLPRKALDTILKPVQNKTLYIYKGRIICHRRGHSIIPATATFYDGSGNKVKIDVEYCQECQRQMMSYTSFTYYRDSFGVLVGNLKMIGSEGFDGEFNMAEESPLRLCGYTVSQQAGLTESTRHYILAKVIHDGIMSKVDVIRYLEHFINMNGSKEGNELALSKWENDLKFVHKYRIDTQPEVYITKVEKY